MMRGQIAHEIVRRCFSLPRGTAHWFRSATRSALKLSPYSELGSNRLMELDSYAYAESREFLSRVDAFRRVMLQSRAKGERRHEALLLGLKLSNLLAMKHDYRHRHTRVVGRPFGYQIDTVNGCNLGCAGCPQTYNKAFYENTYTAWPRGVMKRDVHDEMMSFLGLHAFSGHYYNTSEPLLNKRAAQYFAEANRRRIRTSISSHMSLPKLDVNALVESGLDILQVAIDGVTQSVYERYRRGGDVELAFDNVRRLVAAKKRLRSDTPAIRWHFLTFAHNSHEVDKALEKATELGVNDFFVASPVDVSGDDPSLVVEYHPRQWQNVVINPSRHAPFERRLAPLADDIELAMSESLLERHEALGRTSAKSIGNDRCDWLYMGLYVNAFGALFPCNIGDVKGSPGTLVYGSVRNGSADFNTREFEIARNAINGVLNDKHEGSVRCRDCGGRPTPQIGLRATRPALAGLAGGGFWPTSELLDRLCGWSEHKVVPPGFDEPPARMRC